MFAQTWFHGRHDVPLSILWKMALSRKTQRFKSSPLWTHSRKQRKSIWRNWIHHQNDVSQRPQRNQTSNHSLSPMEEKTMKTQILVRVVTVVRAFHICVNQKNIFLINIGSNYLDHIDHLDHSGFLKGVLADWQLWITNPFQILRKKTFVLFIIG